MRRAIAVLSLVGVLAIPVTAAAQSPAPSPARETVPIDLCITVEAPPEMVLLPELLMAYIKDNIATITAVSECADPAASEAPVATPEPTDAPAKVEYKKLSNRSWAKLVKNPDDYTGKGYQVWACISQFDSATGPDSFLGQTANRKLEFWYTDGENAIFTGDADRLEDFVEDDIVSMNVVSGGSLSYDTQAGGNTTAPVFLVQSIRRRGSCA